MRRVGQKSSKLLQTTVVALHGNLDNLYFHQTHEEASFGSIALIMMAICPFITLAMRYMDWTEKHLSRTFSASPAACVGGCYTHQYPLI